MGKKGQQLPNIIAGPVLRHVDENQVVIWLVTSQSAQVAAKLVQGTTVLSEQTYNENHDSCIQIGQHAWVHLLIIRPTAGVPANCWLNYDIGIRSQSANNDQLQWLHHLMPDICFAKETMPRFVRKRQLDKVLHGSCRKPHYAGADGFLAVDDILGSARRTTSGIARPPLTAQPGDEHTLDSKNTNPTDTKNQPTLMMLHGDQVYIDDVAGPMLLAIKHTIELLGLRDELIAGSIQVSNGSELLNQNSHMYSRLTLLPDTPANTTVIETVFQGAKKPIFTSANADNHLITLAEVLAMYLLVWSPEMWNLLSIEEPEGLLPDQQQRYTTELQSIRDFTQTLPTTRRVLANVPVYMIFDDHDVTDDWNLNQAWVNRAYGHPFSKRIIGNALIGYLLCQGWGNNPQAFSHDLVQHVRDSLAEDEPHAHDSLIDRLYAFTHWDYVVKTEPPVVVIDARTRRWPSPLSSVLPSGLLDEKGLSELQTHLLGQQSVLLVSSAPIFGVKLIEVIQRVFAWCGLALLVDAENWMSHKGAATGILGIFQHPQTPKNFVIISGDVHYSFAYDVRLRRPWRKPISQTQTQQLETPSTSPYIWQITSSGIKNKFPTRLLRFFDRANRWLYAGYSPLNLLTRRRRMHIRPRRPTPHKGRYRHQRLVNATGIGILQFNQHGQPEHIAIRTAEGDEIAFMDGYQTDWH